MCVSQIINFGLLVILAHSISGQQRCRTPSGPIGRCIPFQSCDSLYSLVDRGQQLSPDDYNLIQKSWCDPLDGVQNICCSQTKTTTTLQQTNIIPPQQPPNRNQRIVPTDLTQHPNARLLDIRQCGKSSSDKISHGLKTEPFEFPWMVMIRIVANNELAVVCGGSLITKRYVLSAAHCMETAQGTIPIHSVVLGEHNIKSEYDCIEDDCADPIQIIAVEKQIPHPSFSTAKAKNDIGLLRLKQNARLSDSVTPVCLPYTATAQSNSDTLPKIIVTGWGTTEKQLPADELLKGILDVTPLSKCASIYKKRYFDRIIIDSTSLCALGEQSDSCSGDSGGPAVYLGQTDGYGPRVFQYGIVSAGTRTCGTNYGIPGLYTRVSSYMPWILDNISD